MLLQRCKNFKQQIIDSLHGSSTEAPTKGKTTSNVHQRYKALCLDKIKLVLNQRHLTQWRFHLKHLPHEVVKLVTDVDLGLAFLRAAAPRPHIILVHVLLSPVVPTQAPRVREHVQLAQQVKQLAWVLLQVELLHARRTAITHKHTVRYSVCTHLGYGMFSCNLIIKIYKVFFSISNWFCLVFMFFINILMIKMERFRETIICIDPFSLISLTEKERKSNRKKTAKPNYQCIL